MFSLRPKEVSWFRTSVAGLSFYISATSFSGSDRATRLSFRVSADVRSFVLFLPRIPKSGTSGLFILSQPDVPSSIKIVKETVTIESRFLLELVFSAGFVNVQGIVLSS